MNKKIYVFLLSLCMLCTGLHAQQTSDDQYKMPLKDVLEQIKTQFSVQIKYSEDMVKDRWVNYAEWRFRKGDVEETLANVLGPLDMKVNKEGDKKYKLKYYEYYRWPVEEGKAQLDSLAAQYNDVASWERRKAILRPCLYQALRLSPLPAKPASKPIIVNQRTMDGYTVENIAIETLPGFYVTGSIYKPAKIKGKVPVIISPDGHWYQGRYRKDAQVRCATLARMGCIVASYDLFGWGENGVQVAYEDHRKAIALSIQILNDIRMLDYLLSLKEADKNRVAITGGSGGGSQTELMTALDTRLTLVSPVVSLSCYMYGGCPCESGMPIHFCGGGTDNVELAAMGAPIPQLVISDGKDWTDHVPQIEFPYLKRIYGFYGKAENVENFHIPNEGHDFGNTKREPLYEFIAKHFKLDISKMTDAKGRIDESKVTVEEEKAMYVFGDKGEKLPAGSLKGYAAVEKVFYEVTSPSSFNGDVK